jgi:hypothetical protein
MTRLWNPTGSLSGPYAGGWMFRVRIGQDHGRDAALPPGLLSAAEYEELTKSAG